MIRAHCPDGRRNYLVEVEAFLCDGNLALLTPDNAQGPFPVILDHVPERLTIPSYKREADENLAGRDGPGCVFKVPTYQSDFGSVPALRR